MLFVNVITAFILAQIVLTAPVAKRQLAGEGSACNSIFTSTDNGVGYGVENGEDNLAGTASNLHLRQLHGEGEACDSILTQTDNGVGYGTENAEDNVASNIAGVTGNKGTTSSGGKGSGGPPPPPPGHKRQLDKIANGFGAIGQAAGVGSATDPEVTQLDNLDGTLTDGAANAGASLGQTEEASLEELGSAVPRKRQADKIANGAATFGKAVGVSKVTDPVAQSGDTLDGTLTDGAANLGAGVADSEASILEGTGSSIPVIF